MSDGVLVRSSHVEAAAQREYRRMGSIYPLRRRAPGEGAPS
jgi:hypothetical protein